MIASRFPKALGAAAPLTAVLALALWPSFASAQMQLPGAYNPAPDATPGALDGGIAKPKKAGPPPPPKVPGDEGVAGRALMLNGKAGVIEFRRDGKDLRVARLKLAGDQIGRPTEVCEVDVAGPIGLTPAGKPDGATRYRLDLPACGFSVDILEGAVLARNDGAQCEFKAAGCRVDPAGLWGQPANEIGPQRTKEIESQRRQAEQEMRAAYKAWIVSAGTDRALVSRVAGTQAAFSSRREELCRTYARESQHGYCDLVATHARTLAIGARVLPPVQEPIDADARKTRRR